MRVAHIITRMIIGGAQENTLYNCLDLVEKYRDEVMLICGPEAGPEGELLEQGRGGGVDVRRVDSLRRNISIGLDRRAYSELKSILAQYRPDVVHTHSAKGGLLGRAAAWQQRVPLVVHTVHGAPFHRYQSFVARRFFIACERWAAKRCHHLISVADAMTDLMVAAKVAPRHKFTTIYSGMSIEPFLNASQHRQAVRQRLGIGEEEVVVGKIARLFHLKGHEYLIDAASRLRDRMPRIRFLLVGDGVLRESLVRRIEQRGMTDRFILAGLVSPEQIPEWIGAMDLLVHTSLREGLARTLPQALLAGIPVVSYDIDGAREVVLDGRTGYLLPPREIPGLAEAIYRLASDPAKRAAMGGEGRVLCSARFDHRVMTDAIRGLYVDGLGRAK